MKVSELMAVLATMPQDARVVVFDSERNAYEGIGEPSAEGCYWGFEVDYDNEMFFPLDTEDEIPTPTVVISFESDYIEREQQIFRVEAMLVDDAQKALRIEALKSTQQECYKGHGPCDCPGLCRENC